MNKSSVILSSILIFFVLNTEAKGAIYHCPTLKEASNFFTVRTIINGKDVRWEKLIPPQNSSEHPRSFASVKLTPRSRDSYDKNIFCVYKTNLNRKFIVKPIESWSFYIKGVAEKAIGENWHLLADGSLNCYDSVQNCLFIFK